MLEGNFKIPGGEQTSTAVGFLGNGSRDEFPVLKAFQEYIDAEQGKARKRMLGLSIFFIVLLTLFVIAFMLVLGWLFQRNQKLEDRIFEMSEHERDRAAEQARLLTERTEAARRAGAEAATAAVNAAARLPAKQGSPAEAAEAIKPLLEKIERERAEMKAELAAEKKRLADERAKREAEAAKARAAEAKRQAAAERERKRQEEVERHRRRLYPEYYARLEAGHAPSLLVSPAPAPAAPAPAPAAPAASPFKGLKPVTYFDEAAPKAAAKKQQATVSVAAPTPEPVKREKPKPKKKYETIDVTGDGDVPFLIELPEEKK